MRRSCAFQRSDEVPAPHSAGEPRPDRSGRAGVSRRAPAGRLSRPPEVLGTAADKADYLHRVCAAFDFGIFPDRADWERFAAWRDVFDEHPLPDSPAYHAFRSRYGWPPVPRGTCGLEPPWRLQDRREGRTDPCEHAV